MQQGASTLNGVRGRWEFRWKDMEGILTCTAEKLGDAKFWTEVYRNPARWTVEEQGYCGIPSLFRTVQGALSLKTLNDYIEGP